MNLQRFVDFKEKIVNNVSKVIIGKENEIMLIIVSFLSGGHVLLEDIPGMGKTMMIKAFSRTLDLPFKRIQFTPDLLPSDITGINFYNQKTGDFQFREGPLFSNIVLIDEINRATPRTQSSLLEAMEEKQITADGETRKLHMPFMVLATQNPVESYGTFPLPEAQLDRFFMRIKLGYPTKEEEKIIIKKNIGNPLENIKAIVNYEELDYLLLQVSKVSIHEEVMDYLVNIVSQTRNKDGIELGVSPRGSIALFKASQAYAAISGRDYITPEDIKMMAPYILNHRIIARGVNSIEDSLQLIKGIVEETEVPLENI
ncbi:MoxR family ATPase [Tissierella sp. MB52-C2]|uniref:AAA family ATPase n=1 Tax=Tissierella sp. MB52-C2 TaxID=3070999 RepID=UPI00280BF4D0|nr:MoxR family ATPase [Tissierella sp. MB52-C2]WMM25986.1 MoxR family ATPase [Tissierella sp. MB52-C2]